MKTIKVKTPAKINLTLKVGHKQDDGFHPIESIMQTISLFDYLDVSINEGRGDIKLSGSSNEIPYDEKNIAYKAAKKFMEVSKLSFDINIFIEKNIPVCAGLAGGSTNAAGVIYALNKLHDNILSSCEIFHICKELGSDLNFCMTGSKQMCRGKGDELEALEFEYFPVTLIKPKNLMVSAKEAYMRFDELKEKSNMPNDLEFAMMPYHKELQFLHGLGLQMSGSGPTYFTLKRKLNKDLGDDYLVIDSLESINHGVIEIS